MKIAIIGLGKMGANMARRLIKHGHEVVGYNRNPEKTLELAEESGLQPALSLQEMVNNLDKPKIIWSMVPAGEPTRQIITGLAKILGRGDIIIDGGNSNYKDSMKRADYLKDKGIHFLDVGVSGGVWGLREGYSLMIGGEKDIVQKLKPIFESLAPGKEMGWGHVGPHGSGHFVKMVHNGIEYGMMESIAEGFELMHAKKEFHLDLKEISEIWQHGSVVRSWLLDLTHDALEEDGELSGISGWVHDSGEGRWVIHESIDQAVPVPIMAISLFRRFSSRQDDSFAMKLLAALRNKFGGHSIKKTNVE